jgi:tetratricopeptide (TPR) repeat protein
VAEEGRTGRGAVWVLILLALALPASTLADDEASEEARAAAALGQALFEDRQFAAALIEFETALAGGLRDGGTLYMAGACQRKTGKSRPEYTQTLTEGITALDSVVRQGDGATLTDFSYLAGAYAAVGDRSTAGQVAGQALDAFRGGALGKMDALPPRDLLKLGELARLAGELDTQVEAFGRAARALDAEEEPDAEDLAQALAELGRARLESGDLDGAVQPLVRVMDLKPDYPGARLSYIRVLFRRGEYRATDKQWNALRLAEPAASTEANYARMTLETLSQKDLLVDSSIPVEELTGVSRADLEGRMLSLGQEMGELAATLPEEIVKRGYVGPKTDDDTRASMKVLRDRKLRLAWLAGEYIHRGHPIREFAFTNGLQAWIRPWRLPKAEGTHREPGPIPVDILSPESLAAYEAAMAEREKKPAERKSGKSPAPSEGEENGGG